MTTGDTVLIRGEKTINTIRKGMEKSLPEWKSVSSHLMTARLKGRNTNTTLYQCYALTNDRENTDKNAFYQQLQAEVDAVS